MLSRLSRSKLIQGRKSNFTENLVDEMIRKGYTGPELIDYILPSKQRYRKFKREGSWLKVIMSHPSAAGSKSSTKWENIRSMSKWGWTSTVIPTDYFADIDGIGDLVGESEGLEYQWIHGFEAFLEGPPTTIRYPARVYVNVLYPEQGVIVSTASYSPEAMIEEERTSLGLKGAWDYDIFKPPELQRWSDVVYLSWKAETSLEQRMGLNKIVQHEIINIETRNMLAYVLRMNFKTDNPVGRAPKWPEKRVIYSSMEGFNALLYTPNLRGIVWLLVQHQEQLGEKTIRSITVYESRRETDVYAPTMIVDIVPRGDESTRRRCVVQ